MAKMQSEKVTAAQRAASDRYDAKTFKKILFRLRLQEDADIIKDIEAAKAEGLSLREWLRQLFDSAKPMSGRVETKEEIRQAGILYHQLMEKYPEEQEQITAWWEDSPTLRSMQGADAALELFG